MLKQKEIAEILRIGLILKLIDKDAIISWADFEIAKDNFDDKILDLSLSKNCNEIIEILQSIVNNSTNLDLCDSYFFHFFRSELNADIAKWFEVEKKILDYLFLTRIHVSFDSDIRIFMSELEEDYNLRLEGFEGTMDMPNDVLLFLNDFRIKVFSFEPLDKFIKLGCSV